VRTEAGRGVSRVPASAFCGPLPALEAFPALEALPYDLGGVGDVANTDIISLFVTSNITPENAENHPEKRNG